MGLCYYFDMRLLNKQLLTEFALLHPSARGWTENWVVETQAASWDSPQAIKQRYKTVSFVGKLIIFNVGGNNFRLVVKVAFNTKIVYVNWVGTHSEYDKVNWKLVSHGS